MKEANSPTIADLFAILDAWRHLPAYKLEPRADPFFALFLPEVLTSHLRVEIHATIIPELPLRRATLWGEGTPAPSKSVKVDYAVFSHDRQHAYLVELKTDQGSRRDEQDEYLQAAKRVGLRSLVDGILAICQATDTPYVPKYVHLLKQLSDLGFVDIPGELYEAAFPEVRPGVTAELRNVRNTVDGYGPPIEIVYVQPLADDRHDSIGFEEFARAVEPRGDIGRAFADHLRRWVEIAGRRDPRKSA